MPTTEMHIVKNRVVLDNMKYIPSPITFSCTQTYSAVVNRSGRMQYYRISAGEGKERITREEFCTAYNALTIVGIKPLQSNLGTSVFQMEFYV